MTSTLFFEIVLISVLVFAAVLVFARIYALFEPPEPEAESDEPIFNISEPNRRNQSAAPSA